MTMSADSQKAIDAYLKVLQKRLRGMSEQASDDVVKEIRSHILDKASMAEGITPDSVASVLAALGSPEELARQYATDDLLRRAQLNRSPWMVVQSLVRWASLSLVGLCTLTFSVLGYFLAGSLALCALLKPLHPDTAGLWRLPDPTDVALSLRLGFGPAPVGGRDLLGWWIVPLGLMVSLGLVLLTFQFGLWSIRKFWRPMRVRRD